MMITKFLIERRKVSPYTGNIELRLLRSLFNFGVGSKIIKTNPTDGIAFFPIEKKVKHIPDNEDINKVTALADPDTQPKFAKLKIRFPRGAGLTKIMVTTDFPHTAF
jgi:site-specific recombinase XerC